MQSASTSCGASLTSFVTTSSGKYQDVILPLTVLRRIDCVLEPTKNAVLKRNAELKELGLENRDAQLRKASGYAFYNTSRYDFRKLLADAPGLAANLRNYIARFSPNMREVLDRFDFDNTIARLDDAGLLFLVLERFGSIDLHPDAVDNHEMGEIFEELIRRFNEALNENPGEHFTPREVIQLMVTLMLAGTEDELGQPHITRTVYDPCAGSGGMLTIAKQRVLEINPNADVHLFGQEVNPETWAVTKADLLITSQQGRDAENIKFGSSLSVRVVRFSGAALTEGVEHQVVGKVPVLVYGPAKTVADCFKYRNKIGLDVALEALRDAWRQRRVTMDELWHYAQVCRVANVMRPYLDWIEWR